MIFIFHYIFVQCYDRSDSDTGFNGLDCKWEIQDDYICAKGPLLILKGFERKHHKNPKRKYHVSINDRPQHKRNFTHKNLMPRQYPFPLPPCPPAVFPLPLCPPAPCPPAPCPPAPCPPAPCPPAPCPPAPCPIPYPCPPKFNFITTLERITIERQNEITNYFTSRGKVFADSVREGILIIARNLSRQIRQANGALLNTINGIILPQQSALLQSVTNQINQTNNAVLSGLQGLVNTANAQIEANIVALGALAAAVIQATIQDLTTNAGTLQQILAITNGITTGFNSLFASQTQQELANINTLLANESTAIQAPVTAAIQATNGAIKSLASPASAQSIALVIGLFKKFIADGTIFVEGIVREYGTQIDRLVIAYFS